MLDLRFFAGSFVCLSLAAVAAPAMATASDSDTITIDVKAKIEERCGIAANGPTSSASTPNLEAATTLNFGFKLNCNVPFAIGVSSENGALRLSTATGNTDNANGFSVEKPYNVKLRVDTDGQPMTPDQCSSDALVRNSGGCAFFGKTPGQGLRSGQRTAINREGSIEVSWPSDASSGQRRAAGIYQDTLTVVVGVRN